MACETERSASFSHENDVYLNDEEAKSRADSESIVVEEIQPASTYTTRGSFRRSRAGLSSNSKESKRVKRYYQAQDKLLRNLRSMENMVQDRAIDEETAKPMGRCNCSASTMAKITLAVNLILLVAKAIAAGLSGSLSIISSLLDSAVDLFSGIIIWWSERSIKNRNYYSYPSGRTRLGPVAIIILSTIMGVASLQPIIEAVKQLATNSADPDVALPTIIIMCGTIVIKLVLFIFTFKSTDANLRVLAVDHRNDVVSNSAALLCAFLGSYGMKNWGDKRWSYFDPVGAILISIYIIYNWFVTGREQVKIATGHSADPNFLQQITWLCLNHNEKVLMIDTVRAFHFGTNFLVEVHLILPKTMVLEEAHDIGESLQINLEKLNEVERAFVHLDYEAEHHPNSEHKIL